MRITMRSSNESAWPNVRPPKVRLAAMLLVAIAATTPEPLQAGDNAWTRIGPEGGAIGALAVDPQNLNTIYAAPMTGSTGAVFKSTDGGSTWMSTAPLPCCSAVVVVNVLVIDTH